MVDYSTLEPSKLGIKKVSKKYTHFSTMKYEISTITNNLTCCLKKTLLLSLCLSLSLYLYLAIQLSPLSLSLSLLLCVCHHMFVPI